mgnify:CR=1 FL=1
MVCDIPVFNGPDITSMCPTCEVVWFKVVTYLVYTRGLLAVYSTYPAGPCCERMCGSIHLLILHSSHLYQVLDWIIPTCVVSSSNDSECVCLKT